MADRVGQQLGNYRLVRLLGEGGFAEVYLGEHIYLKSQAAIKVMHTRLAKDDLESFLSESRTLVQLIHPHIVRVLDFGVEDNTPFLVMDYARNGTMRQRHPKGTVVPLALVVDYVRQVADPLQYAHDQKLIHRDIKPENILLGRSNEVLLSDFGIAIVAQSTRSESTLNTAGTIGYMAPEQIQAHPRPASDQYALGIVVYEWLSGARPFQGTFSETVAKHLHVPPPLLREKIPTLAPEVEQVVLTALAKDPRQRFANVRAFATALELASQSPSAARDFMSMSGSPQPAVTINASNQTPQLLADAVAAVPPNQLTLPVDKVTTSDPLVQPSLTVTPSRTPALSPILTKEFVRSSQSHSSKRGIFRLALMVGLVGLAILVIAGSIVVFSPTLMKWVTTPKPSPSNAHTAFCITAHPPSLTNYAMFGSNPQHTNFVPDERRLLPTNVSHLVPCWTVPTGGEIYSSPAVLNGIVYVGSGAKLYAFNAITGTQLWSAPTGGKIWSSPAVANGIVYVGSGDRRLYAFNAITGKQLWTALTGGDIYTSSPVLANGVIYVGSEDDKLYAFNATTGAQLWTTPIRQYIRSAPAVANGILYVGAGYKLYAFNAVTGRQLWVTGRSGYFYFSAPTVANGIVYVGSFDDNNDKLYAFNATTGRQLWAAPTGGKICSSPADANGVVYIGSYDDKLYAFNATTGRQLWAAPTGGKICSSTAVANGVVYVGSLDSKLYAFNSTTGAQLWTAPTRGEIYSSPAVANGVVYVGSYDGKLYAFHLPDKNKTS